MTNPRQMPQFGTWSVPNCPLAIEYDLEILETIRREVTAGFQAPRGGVEVGGLLLGTYDGKRVRITGFEPVGCDHKLGPKFILTEDETEALDSQLLAHRVRGLDEAVVGWYQSHLRRGLTLSSEDIQIYDRHFPEPWQVALLLRPDPAGGIHARFFLREPGTAVRQTSSTPAGDRTRINRDSVTTLPIDNSSEVQPVRTAQTAASSIDPRRGIQNKAVWSVLAAMFVMAVLSVFYMRFNFAVSPHALKLLHLETIARDSGLELRWDPKEFAGASRGQLEIRDGGSVQRVSLDRRTLDSGVFLYRQSSDVIGFRLQAERSSGAPLEGSAMYIGRNAKPEAVAQAAPPPVAAEPVKTLPPPPQITTAAPPPVPPAVESDKSKKQTETVRPAPPVVALPPPTRAAEQPKQAAAAPPVTTASKREEPAKPKPETVTPPVSVQQTAPTTTTEVAATAPTPTPRLETAAAAPPRVIPKEPAPATSAPASPPWRLNGRWSLQNGGYSRSPSVPETVSITVSETDGSVQGTVDARYKGRSKADRVHFSFSGKVINGVARFSWTTTNGQRGHIEFIRVPNSPDVAEVVWQNPETKNVFDEMLRRAN